MFAIVFYLMKHTIHQPITLVMIHTANCKLIVYFPIKLNKIIFIPKMKT